jgi:hypothetical protein
VNRPGETIAERKARYARQAFDKTARMVARYVEDRGPHFLIREQPQFAADLLTALIHAATDMQHRNRRVGVEKRRRARG